MARILIVDDEEMDRLLGRAALEEAGHELFFAADGEIALRAYQKTAIDLVITDLAMPHVNGFRLIEEIMQADGDALIIAVSGVSPEQLDRAMELGAVQTMVKPYSARELLDAVSHVLNESRARPPNDLWG